MPGLPPPFDQSTKIALIAIGRCSLIEKVQQAQNDNASAAIVYISGSFDSETNLLMVSTLPMRSLFVVLDYLQFV